jgi:uncharacterized protein YdeI (YjbR/CyaY-like superfamily)
MSIKPVFFAKPSEFSAWLQKSHAREAECWVGYYKKGTGRPSMTWPESVDEALCFGWIDGIRKSIDESSYMIRFTPRKPTSIWSAVNIGRVTELTRLKRMKPTGLVAFERRNEVKSKVYAYEQAHAQLDEALEQKFRKHRRAWDFFQAQPPSYRKVATWWVVSAKREDTRLRRLDTLIADSAAGQRISQLRRPED